MGQPYNKTDIASVDEILLTKYVNWSTNFVEKSFNKGIAQFCLIFVYWNLRIDQCRLRPAPGYVAEIQLGPVYLRDD